MTRRRAALDLADRGDDAAVDGDVAGAGRPPRSVGDRAAADDQVVHGCSSPALRCGAAAPVRAEGAAAYTQLRSFSIMATGSGPTGVTLRWVTPASASAATRSLM